MRDSIKLEQQLPMIKPEGNVILPSLSPLSEPSTSFGYDVTKIKTKRGTLFGRSHIVSLWNEQKNELLFLISDFELRILKSNHKTPLRCLLSCEEVNDHTYKYVLNINIHDTTSKVFMPIGHWLMHELKTEQFELILSWFQKEYGTFFKPSLFITDFNFEMFHAWHVLYEKTPKYISIVDFIIKSWKNALSSGILAESEVPDDYIKFLWEMPDLLLSHDENSKELFGSLVNRYLPPTRFQRFIKPYMEIFINQPSWYNIYSLASSYKNIFWNVSKSQELHKRMFLSNKGLSALEATKNYEAQLWSLHESLTSGGSPPQKGSLYKLVKLYFNKYHNNKVALKALLGETIEAMNEFGISPKIRTKYGSKGDEDIEDLLAPPDLKQEIEDDLIN